MKKVIIHAPSSTANLGSGFDTMGIALSLYNTVELEEWDSLLITAADGSDTPIGKKNLVYTTAQQVATLCGTPFKGLKITQQSPIPQARGLGSSSACIAAGVVGANRLLGSPLCAQQQLELACKIEGHPDNVAPAMLGGFVTSVLEDGKVYTIKKEVDSSLCFCAFVPDFRLLTAKARAVLPTMVPYGDAVYNVSRAALMAAAFCEHRPELLAIGAEDRLHQPYRMELIPGARTLFCGLLELGAKAVFISGAGPTIMAVLDGADTAFLQKATKFLQQTEETTHFKPMLLHAHNESML